jgi:hypothetical protein
MKKLAIALGVAGALAASQASAAPLFSFTGGYTGPFVIKFSNFEGFSSAVLAPGVENFGILKISSILDDNANTIWSDGQNGAELTGVFRDIIIDSITPVLSGTTPTGFSVKSTGGLLDIYINPTGSLNAAGGPAQGLTGYTDAGCLPGDGCYDGISNVGAGGVFLNLAWRGGIDPTDSDITVDGDFDLASFPSTGDAAGFLDVIGGPYAGRFDTNGQPTAFGPADLFSQNDFCPNGSPACGTVGTLPTRFPFLSEDPVRGVVIPEPGTLALLGISLLGLVGLRRKKTV